VGLLTTPGRYAGFAPDTNSYRRLVRVRSSNNLVYSSESSACCGFRCIRRTAAKRVEFRSPILLQPYLAFAAMMLMAALRHQQPHRSGQPIDKNLMTCRREAKEVKSTPGSLDQALDALERDHAFLLRAMCHARRDRDLARLQAKKEVDAIRLRPIPRVSPLLDI